MFDLNKILRNNIKNLIPYSSARNEFKGREGIFLNANENPFGSPLSENYNRYPDPLQLNLKEKISKIKNIHVENIFIGNGSDEAIDILFRAFCNPGKDNVIICPPTYGMYEVSANINDIEVRKVNLLYNFQLDVNSIISAIDDKTKLIFICSPNNPTGNSLNGKDVEYLLKTFDGIIVVDEAYINFSKEKSFANDLRDYPNLVVLQTFSKAWGMAGLRVGMAFASGVIVDVFNKIKPPYNVNSVSQKLALEALNNINVVDEWVKQIVAERERMSVELAKLPFVIKVYSSDANFILLKTIDANEIYNYLLANKIIIRNRSNITMCEGCLRITIGTKEENKIIIDKLKQYKNEESFIYRPRRDLALGAAG